MYSACTIMHNADAVLETKRAEVYGKAERVKHLDWKLLMMLIFWTMLLQYSHN